MLPLVGLLPLCIFTCAAITDAWRATGWQPLRGAGLKAMASALCADRSAAKHGGVDAGEDQTVAAGAPENDPLPLWNDPSQLAQIDPFIQSNEAGVAATTDAAAATSGGRSKKMLDAAAKATLRARVAARAEAAALSRALKLAGQREPDDTAVRARCRE